ncbi:hypothetical protein ZIOFF_072562 [Zingiber officinale]|uniref:Secreted protein n=1 Tax=Zingiber officinale TaxID=94328 RepID=A0A8J5BZ11_ZINOF|nr:hypothetical protein ZIOFF_072562 [Zingiber officinale]
MVPLMAILLLTFLNQGLVFLVSAVEYQPVFLASAVEYQPVDVKEARQFQHCDKWSRRRGGDDDLFDHGPATDGVAGVAHDDVLVGDGKGVADVGHRRASIGRRMEEE